MQLSSHKNNYWLSTKILGAGSSSGWVWTGQSQRAVSCSGLCRNTSGSAFTICIQYVNGLRTSCGGNTKEVILHVPPALQTSCPCVLTKVELHVSGFYNR